LSLTQLKNQVKAKAPLLRLGHRLAGARRPDCDHAREALFPNPPERAARKGDGLWFAKSPREL